jgi:acyl carrier protein
MTREEIRSSLKDIFREIFDGLEIEPTDDLTAKQVDGWNSVTHIDLICAVEDKFAFAFSTSEIARLQNVGELITAVERKANA